MSVVGPRPKLPGEAERYGSALDVEYVLTRNLGEYIRIVAETTRQVLLSRCDGAY